MDTDRRDPLAGVAVAVGLGGSLMFRVLAADKIAQPLRYRLLRWLRSKDTDTRRTIDYIAGCWACGPVWTTTAVAVAAVMSRRIKLGDLMVVIPAAAYVGWMASNWTGDTTRRDWPTELVWPWPTRETAAIREFPDDA